MFWHKCWLSEKGNNQKYHFTVFDMWRSSATFHQSPQAHIGNSCRMGTENITKEKFNHRNNIDWQLTEIHSPTSGLHLCTDVPSAVNVLPISLAPLLAELSCLLRTTAQLSLALQGGSWPSLPFLFIYLFLSISPSSGKLNVSWRQLHVFKKNWGEGYLAQL
jgi:hypothetical protein